MENLHPIFQTILAPYAPTQDTLPPFRVGQVWVRRKSYGHAFVDYQTVVAITDHEHSPVITQSACGASTSYGLDGMYGDEPCDFDLVRLVKP